MSINNKKNSKMERLVLNTDQSKIDYKTAQLQKAIDVFNDVKDYYKSIEVDVNLSDSFMIELIKTEWNENIVNNFVEKQFTNENKYIRQTAQKLLKDDLLSYDNKDIYDFDTDYIEIQDGKAVLKEKALENIKEVYTTYLTDPKAIELRQRHLKLVEDTNQLIKDFGLTGWHGTRELLFILNQDQTLSAGLLNYELLIEK